MKVIIGVIIGIIIGAVAALYFMFKNWGKLR